jgi:hypothetical protein
MHCMPNIIYVTGQNEDEEEIIKRVRHRERTRVVGVVKHLNVGSDDEVVVVTGRHIPQKLITANRVHFSGLGLYFPN